MKTIEEEKAPDVAAAEQEREVYEKLSGGHKIRVQSTAMYNEGL